jgi:ABC-type sugar transport system substrate-binding protein
MGKKTSIVVCALVVLCMIVAMVGCGTGSAPVASSVAPASSAPASVAPASSAPASAAPASSAPASAAASYTEKQIGLAQTSVNHPFWVAFMTGLNTEAAKYPLKIDFQSGNDDPDTQTKQIETFITEKKDAIIIVAASVNSLVPAAKECNAANIPVFTINRLLQSPDNTSQAQIVCYEGADDYQGGSLQGQAVAKLLNGKGNIIVSGAAAGSSPGVNRTAGLKDYLTKNAPDIKILDVTFNANDNLKAQTYVQNMLTRYPKGQIDAIVVQGPYDAIACAQECQTEGRTELVGKVIGFDYPKVVQDAIKSGLLYATVDQNPMLEGTLGADILNMYFSGQQSQIKNPWYIDLPIITMDNVDTIPPAWVDAAK